MKRVISVLMFVILLFGFQGSACSGMLYDWEMLDNISVALEENLEDGSVLGLGVVYPERPYKGVDNEVIPAPIMVVEMKQFFIL